MSVHILLCVSFLAKIFDIATRIVYDEHGSISSLCQSFRRGDAVAAADTHLIANNYTPVGDLIVVAICFVMLALIFFSYMRKTPAFRVFMTIIFTLILTALLDVTFPEPPEAGSKLYTLPNVRLSPHIAGSMNDEVHRMSDYMIAEYKRFASGEPCLYEVSESMLLTSKS